jgi:hypothetical protein
MRALLVHPPAAASVTRVHGLATPPGRNDVKWILCPGCDEYRFVHFRARTCSGACRNRVWRRRHGVVCRRRAFCAWCKEPLLYLPQDWKPGVRSYWTLSAPVARGWSHALART